ncbi:hypothetical protein ACT80S_00080 [Ramlibacter sp. MAHUQ-53]|uniref:hypothetical protein n=1 Tax=unclassified Ramlibacter TaxID=2617605 RepID=UPI00366D39A4
MVQADGPDSAASSSGRPRQTEAQRINAATELSQRQRRGREIEEILIPDVEQRSSSLRAQCDREMAALRNRKQSAANNLAGATWELSLSSEMSAVATRCDTKQREMALERENLLKECSSTGSCRR